MKFRSDRWLAATGLLAAGALLVACGSSDDSAAPSSTTESAPGTTSASASESTTTTTAESGGTSDESVALIEAAVDGGDPVVCDMEMKDGGSGTAYIRGLDSLRADLDDVDVGGQINMLLADDQVYFWAPEDSRSVAFGPAMAEEMDMMPTVDDLIDGDNSVLDCEVYDGDDTVFSAPTDVEFTVVDDEPGMALWLIDDLQSDDPSVFGQFSFEQMTAAEQEEVEQLSVILEGLSPAEREELIRFGN